MLLFPQDVSYGYSRETEFNTTILRTNNGFESRNSNWKNDLRGFVVKLGARNQRMIEDLICLYLVGDGPLTTFLFKDWLDYKSTKYMDESITNQDQNIGTGDGVKTQFQIIKTYSCVTLTGTANKSRDVTKIKTDTLIVSTNGAPTTAYTVDPLTGIITFNVAPINEAVVKCGYEFYINCRFKDDKNLANIVTFNIAETSVGIVEVRE